MDILTVSIDAGLSFDIALKRALDTFTEPQGGNDGYLHGDTDGAKPRRIALTELGERNNVAELKSLASAVMQSEQMGTRSRTYSKRSPHSFGQTANRLPRKKE